MASIRGYRRDRILDHLRDRGIETSIRGSWLYGDFHLSKEGDYSLSDLDLVIDGETLARCGEIAHEVATSLKQVISLRVSVHPARYLEAMELDDAKFLVIGEYLANVKCYVPLGQTTKDYIRAKCALMVLRNSISERYAEVARRIGTIEAYQALSVKLGSSDVFSSEVCCKLLSECSEQTVVEYSRYCLLDDVSDNHLDSILRRLANSSSVHPWLLKNLARKINRELRK